MSLLDVLKSMIPGEIIDGANVEDVAKMVMLTVEFTPVLPYRIGNDTASLNMDLVPIPCRVQMDGSRWCVWIPYTNEKYRWVDEDELKVMRARYLLLKNFYARNIERMSHPHRQEVLWKFFPDGLFKPACLLESPEAIEPL